MKSLVTGRVTESEPRRRILGEERVDNVKVAAHVTSSGVSMSVGVIDGWGASRVGVGECAGHLLGRGSARRAVACGRTMVPKGVEERIQQGKHAGLRLVADVQIRAVGYGESNTAIYWHCQRVLMKSEMYWSYVIVTARPTVESQQGALRGGSHAATYCGPRGGRRTWRTRP